MKIYLIILVIILTGITCSAQSRYFFNYNKNLEDILEENDTDTSRLTVIIDKSDYRLTLLSDTTVLKEYPVVFGKNPTDDKLRQGDKCTPEGVFYMRMNYPHLKWSKFIWINYPTEDSWAKHNLAIQRGKISEGSEIGGEIGIHGVPDGMDVLIDVRYNWTDGCVSLKNKDINEIYPFISRSTRILIRK